MKGTMYISNITEGRFKEGHYYRVDLMSEGQVFLEECTVTGTNLRKTTIVTTNDYLLNCIQNGLFRKI